MRSIWLGVAALWGLACSASAQAASFSVLCDGVMERAAQECSILLSGTIIEGDADRLITTLKRRPPQGWRYGQLVLDSNGGSVSEAMRLADLVRRALLDTTTSRSGPERTTPQLFSCVSACFLVWVAGAERQAIGPMPPPFDKPPIGLHRPFFRADVYKQSPEKIAAQQQQAMQQIEAYLRREQTPQHLIEKMLQRPSTEVYWLTGEDVEAVTGHSSWFEEMMISRCGWNPSYEAAENGWMFSQIMDRKGTSESLHKHPRYRRFIAWRQAYNACQYGIRDAAQAALR